MHSHTFYQFISFLFHPLWMLFYILAVIFLFGSNENSFIIANTQDKLLLFTSIWIMSIIIPAVAIYRLYRLKIISHLHFPNRKDRLLSLAITAFSHILLLFMHSNKLFRNTVILDIISATVFMLFITIVFTSFYKISFHSIGIGSIIGILLWLQVSEKYNVILPLFFFLAICGIVMQARLALNSHHILELISGLIVGFIGVLIFLYLFT